MSICWKQDESPNPLLVASNATCMQTRMTYPVIVVEVEGIKCSALMDTHTGVHVSAALLDHLPSLLLGALTREVEISTIKVSEIDSRFSLPVEETN